MGKKFVKQALFFLFFTILVASDTFGSQEHLESQISSINIEQNSGMTQAVEVAKRYLQTTAVVGGTGITLTTSSLQNYSGLIIYQQLPLTWTIGQIFQVKGKLKTVAGTSGTYVSFTFISKLSSSQKYYFSTLVPQGKTQWTLNVDTRNIKAGDYYLAFYSGLSGSYSTSTVYKLITPGTQIIKVGAPAAPSGCSLNLIDNALILKWNEDGKTPIEKVTFTQTGINPVQYILSNFQSTLKIQHKDFANFGPGSVTVTISSAYSQLYSVSGKISQYSSPWIFTFKAGYHRFSEEKTGITFSTVIPWKVPVGASITLSGTSSIQFDNIMVVEEPQFTIGKYPLTSSTSKFIPVGTTFSKSLTLNKQGAYILEINSNTGGAIINRPIYVGEALPLLPDFADLTPQRQISAIVAAQPQTLDGLRNSLLTLINQRRAAWGKASLVFETALNNLAQSHSNDMVARNFFGHVNPDKDGPQQRATKAGITYGVGQNVAYNLDLVDGHQRLSRSPGHLANIVNGDYTRVGLGIARNSQGYLYITENYAGPSTTTTPSSTNTISSTTSTTSTNTSTSTNSSSTSTISDDLTPQAKVESSRVQVRDWMLQNYPIIQEDGKLSDIISNWQALGTTQSIFDYIWNTADYPSNYLSSTSFTSSFSTTFTSGFKKDVFFKPPDVSYTTFGVSAVIQPDGRIQVRAVYAK